MNNKFKITTKKTLFWVLKLLQKNIKKKIGICMILGRIRSVIPEADPVQNEADLKHWSLPFVNTKCWFVLTVNLFLFLVIQWSLLLWPSFTKITFTKILNSFWWDYLCLTFINIKFIFLDTSLYCGKEI